MDINCPQITPPQLTIFNTSENEGASTAGIVSVASFITLPTSQY
jgi:hypothetical protein